MRLQQHEVSLPPMMKALAETEAEAGHPDAGLTTIEMQLAAIERTGQLWFLASSIELVEKFRSSVGRAMCEQQNSPLRARSKSLAARGQ